MSHQRNSTETMSPEQLVAHIRATTERLCNDIDKRAAERSAALDRDIRAWRREWDSNHAAIMEMLRR